jgi:cytidylate kinase
MIIAIDGPSGTGKSTVAKGVAKRLGFIFFDTGAMYRSFSWYLLHQGVSPENHEEIKRLLAEFRFDIRTDESLEKHYFVNGSDVTKSIRTQEISGIASQVAQLSFVREALVKIQREFGHKADAVFEGRDMGTVVFPEAEIKIFLTARSRVRAERRYRELMAKFPDLSHNLSLSQIEKEIEERDHSDSTRTISPLRQAKDAILIDTSDLTAEEAIDRIAKLVAERSPRKFPPMRASYRFVYLLARTFFRVFYRLRVYGLHHFHTRAGIIAANHASYFDPPVISISCPEEVHFLARDSLFRIPLLGRLIRLLNSHAVRRDASDVQTFRVLIQLLQTGQKVILFPEGKRSLDGNLQPLEKGLSFLVFKAHCSILPVYVDGAYAAWKPGQRLPKLFGGRISCAFGTPIEWEEFEGMEKREAMQAITVRTEHALQALEKWVQAGCQGSPP